MEARILFRLELPSHKSIGVKAKASKTVEEVLAPILQQYGWNISEVDVYVDEDSGSQTGKVVLSSGVSVIDNKRLFVVQQNSYSLPQVKYACFPNNSRWLIKREFKLTI